MAFSTDFTRKVAFFTDLMRKIVVFRCKFYSPKFCSCKKNDKYQVWNKYRPLYNFIAADICASCMSAPFFWFFYLFFSSKWCSSRSGWQKLREVWSQMKIQSPNIRYFVAILRFVAIYPLFENLWAKKCLLGQKQCFLGKKSIITRYILHYT